MYHDVFILTSMSKDGAAAEMDPEDDAQQYIAKSLGVGAMQRQKGKQIWNNGLNGNVQSTSVALDVDDNSSEDESPQFVGVKTCAAPTGKVVDDDLVCKLGRVRKRAGKLAFSSESSPGTAAKASKVYKRIVAGNDLITSICRDFPEKLLQEVVTMSMTMMTPPKTKKR